MFFHRVAGALWLAAATVFLTAVQLGAHAATPDYDSSSSGSTANLLTDSFRAAHHGRYSEAIADDTKAISIAPRFGFAYYDRADRFMEAGRYAEAAADYDRVTTMHPDDFTVAFSKAKLMLRRGDPTAALAQIKIVVTMPLFFYWRELDEVGATEAKGGQTHATGHAPAYIYAFSSVVEQAVHQDAASLYYMGEMLKIEREHPEYILANYCWEAALAGLLESAEAACEQSIEDNSHDIGQYDSLGFVHLRMKAWTKAIADYNKSLDGMSDRTTSLYGRGIARRATGDIAGGNADIAAATRDEPDIANIMKRLGAPAN